MRMKDLKVGATAWYGKPKELQRGLGTKVKIAAIGHYTTIHEPCGAVYVKNPAPGTNNVIIEFNSADKYLARLNSSESTQKYKRLYDGRLLMHEAEHKILRQAAADRKLETDAHLARGSELGDQAVELVRKVLADLGWPLEYLTLTFDQYARFVKTKKDRWGHHVPGIRVQVDADAVHRLTNSKELEQLLKEWQEWKKQPVPGRDCVV